ncbi:MAG: FAD-dependent oxidoreductase [Alphaproteobacteria bacterium HGW-Alphaproteobacteria-6]|nr:MAG: FAD-dependent oxidoreductase [Alphaproteobacteria bacterium HGW-Alphaproteobacteria-6]
MMRRIYEDHAYGPGPVADCWWDRSAPRPAPSPALEGAARADVAIIGAGYAGLSAALHLAGGAGADVAVLEAETVGWGASGRNGGFCCIGGAKADDAAIAARFGAAGLDDWHRAQIEAIDLVAELAATHAIDIDRHSQGEVALAHRPREMALMRAGAGALAARYRTEVEVIEAADLAAAGLGGAGFHGAVRMGRGFALNPLKYALGLAGAARAAGARIFEQSPVTAITPDGQGGYLLTTPGGQLRAARLILATNGYSSDDLPDWMRARYLPAQSAVLVTRPLTPAEIAAQGWTSRDMAYDTRHLLHYFRLMPDNRFLFGMRGGVSASAPAQGAMRAAVRRDFQAMFPAWAGVETPHYWSGLVCLARDFLPHVGPIGDWPNAWAGFAWHGNGVAMGTYAGRLLAGLAGGTGPAVPAVMATVPPRLPFGRHRRALMHLAYGWYGLRDRL